MASSEKFIPPANSRACTAALSWFRTTATKILCRTHGTVKSIIAVSNVIAAPGTSTEYHVRLECGCERTLLYSDVDQIARRPVKAERIVFEAVVEEAA